MKNYSPKVLHKLHWLIPLKWGIQLLSVLVIFWVQWMNIKLPTLGSLLINTSTKIFDAPQWFHIKTQIYNWGFVYNVASFMKSSSFSRGLTGVTCNSLLWSITGDDGVTSVLLFKHDKKVQAVLTWIQVLNRRWHWNSRCSPFQWQMSLFKWSLLSPWAPHLIVLSFDRLLVRGNVHY